VSTGFACVRSAAEQPAAASKPRLRSRGTQSANAPHLGPAPLIPIALPPKRRARRADPESQKVLDEKRSGPSRTLRVFGLWLKDTAVGARGNRRAIDCSPARARVASCLRSRASVRRERTRVRSGSPNYSNTASSSASAPTRSALSLISRSRAAIAPLLDSLSIGHTYLEAERSRSRDPARARSSPSATCQRSITLSPLRRAWTPQPILGVDV